MEEKYKADTVKPIQLIGYYSAKSGGLGNYTIWKTPDGGQVEVTEVCDEGQKSSQEEAVLVGPVTEFVSRPSLDPENPNSGTVAHMHDGLVWYFHKSKSTNMGF